MEEDHLGDVNWVSTRDGWMGIRIGEAYEDVLIKIRELGLAHKHVNKYSVQVEQPSVTLYFIGQADPRLVMLVFYELETLVDGKRCVRKRLDKLLREWEIENYRETIWSYVFIKSEFTDGRQYEDEKRVTDAQPIELMEYGTLWLKDRNTGLVMQDGAINAVAIISPEAIPVVGSGELTEEQVQLAGHEGLKLMIHARRNPVKMSKVISGFGRQLISYVLAMAGVWCLVYPGTLVYKQFQAWKNPVEVEGKVTSLIEMEGFVQDVIVGYADQNQQELEARIPATYSPTRTVGEKVVLFYQPQEPTKAYTHQQMNDLAWCGEIFEYLFLVPVGVVMIVMGMLGSRK